VLPLCDNTHLRAVLIIGDNGSIYDTLRPAFGAISSKMQPASPDSQCGMLAVRCVSCLLTAPADRSAPSSHASSSMWLWPPKPGHGELTRYHSMSDTGAATFAPSWEGCTPGGTVEGGNRIHRFFPDTTAFHACAFVPPSTRSGVHSAAAATEPNHQASRRPG
jgi:hypothetical protein